MSDIILATSVGMSESVADNGAAFAYLLQQAAAYGKTAVINGKFNIQTPQVFTGLGQFSIRSSEPNKVDQGQGPELNYTGLPTDQPLFKFVGCYNASHWGDPNFGITINLRQSCKYGINTHVSWVSGENNHSNAAWNYEKVYVNWAADGGAGIRLTGSINNSEHRFYLCTPYSGDHRRGLKTVTINTAGVGLPNGTYNDVVLDSITAAGSFARAKLIVSGGIVTSATITSNGRSYAVGETLTIHAIQAAINQSLADTNYAASYANKAKFTVATVITNEDINSYPFTNNTNNWNFYDDTGAGRQSVNDYNNYSIWIDGPPNGITSAPTTGTWHTGQHILNWTAAGGYGSPVGWYCTAGGTSGGTWTALSSLGDYGLGDPHKGAAGIEIDNWNAVNIEIRNCGFGLGAQGIRMMRGGARSYDTNFGPNSDVDIVQDAQVIVHGGWTEQSNRFIFEPFAHTDSTINVSDMRIASYPYGYAGLNEYSPQQSNPLTYSAIWTGRCRGVSVINSNLTALASGSTSYYSLSTSINQNNIPMQLMVLFDSDKPPENPVGLNSRGRIAGVWNDSNHMGMTTSDIFKWNYLYAISLYK